VRVGGEPLPLTAGAESRFAEALRLPRRQRLVQAQERANDWLAERDRVLVRVEQGAVRAVLPGETRGPDHLELLDVVLRTVRAIGVGPRVDHCDEEDGDLHLTLYCPGVARELRPGDWFYGGFYLANTETGQADTEASVRIFRLVCQNGAIIDAAEGQRLEIPRIERGVAAPPPPEWPAKLQRVVERSFDGGVVDENAGRFESAYREALATPYEFLLNLIAQGLIAEAERDRIQRAFADEGEESMFGLINAVTRLAHAHRAGGEWSRAFQVERLGGEILRGDHRPPVLEPVLAR